MVMQEKAAMVCTAFEAAMDNLFSQPPGMDEESCREFAEAAFIRSLEESTHG